VAMQEFRQQQAGRTTTNDGNLSFHAYTPFNDPVC
jgi:hypothetical protein